MTRKEFTECMAVLTTVYQGNVTPELLDAYFAILGDNDPELMKLAVKKVLREHVYPTLPKPAVIQQAINSLRNYNQLNEAEAWALVLKLVEKHGYASKEQALEKMPELTKRTVEAMGWRELCLTTQPEIVRAQFLRIYQINQKRTQDTAQLAQLLELKAVDGFQSLPELMKGKEQ